MTRVGGVGAGEGSCEVEERASVTFGVVGNMSMSTEEVDTVAVLASISKPNKSTSGAAEMGYEKMGSCDSG